MTHSLFRSKALAFKNLAKKRWGSNKNKTELCLSLFLFRKACNHRVRAGFWSHLTLRSRWSAWCPATFLAEGCPGIPKELSILWGTSLGGCLVRHERPVSSNGVGGMGIRALLSLFPGRDDYPTPPHAAKKPVAHLRRWVCSLPGDAGQLRAVHRAWSVVP